MLGDYHTCEKIRIGSSEIAALIAVGCGEDDLKTTVIDYGEDGSYSAYLCGEKTAIPNYYKKYNCWNNAPCTPAQLHHDNWSMK